MTDPLRAKESVMIVGDDPRMSTRHEVLPEVSLQKLRTGFSRVWHATCYSLAGLRSGCSETAFRQEAIAAMALVPLAIWIGRRPRD